MRRFFVEEILGDYAFASERESLHIVKVLRLKKGEEVIIFDNSGNCRKAVITENSPQRVEFKITETVENNSESPIDIKIYQAVIKNDKFDYVVQKCAELGAETLQPFISKYCVKKPKNPELFIERANRIALEASKQCGRYSVPDVSPIIDIKEIPETMDGFLCFLLYEREISVTFKAALQMLCKTEKSVRKIAVIVGPEGGFSEKEALYLEQAEVISVSLGKRILRAETAAPAVCAMLLYEFEL